MTEMPYKNFGAETFYAADVNNYLMRQSVIRVANDVELASIPAPETGMVAYRATPNAYMQYNGATWVPLKAGQYNLVSPALASTSGAVSGTELTIFTTGSSGFVSPSGRIRLQVMCRLQATAANDAFIVRLRNGSLTGTQLAAWYVNIGTYTSRTSVPSSPEIATITANSPTQVFFTLQRVSGTGTAQVLADTRIVIDEDPA
jgi:hypothetical protein